MFLSKVNQRFVVSDIKFIQQKQSRNNVTVMEPFTYKKSFIQESIAHREAKSLAEKEGMEMLPTYFSDQEKICSCSSWVLTINYYLKRGMSTFLSWFDLYLSGSIFNPSKGASFSPCLFPWGSVHCHGASSLYLSHEWFRATFSSGHPLHPE